MVKYPTRKLRLRHHQSQEYEKADGLQSELTRAAVKYEHHRTMMLILKEINKVRLILTSPATVF